MTGNVSLARFSDKIVTIRCDIMKFRISQSLAVVGNLMIGYFGLSGCILLENCCLIWVNRTQGQVLRWLRVLRFLTRLT